MTSGQIAVRLPAEVLAAVDELVARGAYRSRAAVVRAGIHAVAELDRRRTIDQEMVDGYRRIPVSAEEDVASLASLREAILEEPW